MQARCQGGDPADRFLSLLQVALVTGQGYIADQWDGHRYKPRIGPGNAERRALIGHLKAGASVGYREGIYSWNRGPAMTWPRKWQGLSFYPWGNK
jgi:hypothetical protein